MGKLCSNQKVGDGMIVSGRGNDITIEITDIKGPRDRRVVDVNITGGSIESLTLYQMRPFEDVADGVGLGVGRLREREESQAKMIYNAHEDYTLTKFCGERVKRN
jgi:hypothetical protein